MHNQSAIIKATQTSNSLKLTNSPKSNHTFLYFTGNDLDSIRALFSEKEKELSLAVAKVEALTRQLEDLRRDRRGPLNLIPGGSGSSGAGQSPNSPAALELEKLRRELMVSDSFHLTSLLINTRIISP